MPDVDLSAKIPPTATWVKIHYTMKPVKPGAELIARVWSGILDEAVVIKGDAGDAFVKLNKPQTLSYQRPVTVHLELRVVGYKEGESL
jgi:hypothetical protein